MRVMKKVTIQNVKFSYKRENVLFHTSWKMKNLLKSE